jgi:hypothetical protein
LILSCGACGLKRELDERSLQALAPDEEGWVACPVCEARSARVLPLGSAGSPHISTVPPLQDLGECCDRGWAGRPLILRRGDRDFKVRDLDRLRRLVVQRKAAASDLLSADGVRWVPLSRVEALEPYLAVVRFLDSAPVTGGGGVLVEATAAEEGWGDGGVAVEAAGEIEEP